MYAMPTLLLANTIGMVGFGIIAGSPPSEVEIGALHIHLHGLAPMKALLHQGRGVGAFLEGERVILRHHGRRDIASLFAVQKFRCDFDAEAWLIAGAVGQPTRKAWRSMFHPKGARSGSAQCVFLRVTEFTQMPVKLCGHTGVSSPKKATVNKTDQARTR